MPKLIVKSGYTTNVKHFVNNLEYGGNKIAEQSVVLNNGETVEFNSCKKINLDELGRENITAIYLTFKEGKTVPISVEKYEAQAKTNVTIEQVIEEIPDKDILDNKLPNELKDLEFFKYTNYVGERPGVVKVNNCGLFSLIGDIKASEAEEQVRSDIFNRGWLHIISMDAADAERTGYNNRAAWRDLVISKAPEIAKAYNISLENLRFYGGFHANTDNPHVHLNFYSTNPSEGFVKNMESASKKVKSLFTNAIFKDDVEEIKEAIGISKTEMEKAMEKILATKNVSNEYVQKLKQIAYTLPEHGKHHYQFASTETKQLVQQLLKIMLEGKELAPIYNSYLNAYEQYAKFYADNPDVIAAQKKIAADGLICALSKNSWRKLHNEIMNAAVEVKKVLNTAPVCSKDMQSSNSLGEKAQFNIKVTEKSSQQFKLLKKEIYKAIGNSLLTDKSDNAAKVKNIFDDVNINPFSLLNAAIGANDAVQPLINDLAQELADKPITEDGLLVSSEQILSIFNSEDKNNPLIKFVGQCLKNYPQMAVAQTKKHCNKLNKVAGRHTLNLLEKQVALAEPQLCQLYAINAEMSEIIEKCDNNNFSSEEDEERLVQLNTSRKQAISKIYNAVVKNDSIIEKYGQKLLKQAKKHFDNKHLKKISELIINDISNGSPYSAPGSYISIFATNLPDYYIKHLSSSECKEVSSEMFKAVSDTINEKMTSDATFAETMQHEYLQLLDGKEIDLNRICSQIFVQDSKVLTQKQQWLFAMEQSIKQHVPAEIQLNVLDKLSNAAENNERVLPYNNAVFHSIANLPDYYIKHLSSSERKEVSSEMFKAVSETINEKMTSDATFAETMQHEYLQLLDGKEIDLNRICSQIFVQDSKVLTQKQQWLFAMEQSIKQHVPAEIQLNVLDKLSNAAENNERVLPYNNAVFHSIANLPDYYIKHLSSSECKEVSSEMFKAVSDTINEKMTSDATFAETMQHEYLQLLDGKEIDLNRICSQIFVQDSKVLTQKQQWLFAMEQSIKQHVPAEIQLNVLDKLLNAAENNERVLPYNNAIFYSIANLPETVTTSILKDNPLFSEFLISVKHVLINAIKDGQRIHADKTLSHSLRQLTTVAGENTDATKKQLIDNVIQNADVTISFNALKQNFEKQFASFNLLDFSQTDFENEIFYEGFQSISSTVDYYSENYDVIDDFFRQQRIEAFALHLIKGIAQALYNDFKEKETNLSYADSKLTGQGELTRKHSALSLHKGKVDFNW